MHSIFKDLFATLPPQMPNGLVITPTEMKFAAPYTRTVSVLLCLENTTADLAIAFKVMTLDPTRYLVKPTNGVIAPKCSAKITVELQPLADDAAIDKLLKTKQKFKIDSLSSSLETASPSAATMFSAGGPAYKWHYTELECVFEGQTEANTEKSNSYSLARSAPVDDLNDPLCTKMVSILFGTGGTAESAAVSAAQGTTPQVGNITEPASVSLSQQQYSHLIDLNRKIITLLAIITVMLALILAFK